MWTPDIVRARFIEAADVARRLPYSGMSTAMGFWPTYEHSFEDKAGWGTKRLAEEREMRARRQPPTSAALSRHDEVVGWIAKILDDERKRRILWAWAMCHSADRSFSARCRHEGWVKITAYRRLNAAIEAISVYLHNNNILLRLPDEKHLIQVSPDMACIRGNLGEEPDAKPNAKNWSDGERAKPLYEAADTAWAERQWKREAKRRAKLKMDAA